MRPQLLMFCVGVFAIGTILSLAYSGRWFTSGDIDILNTLAMVRGVEVQVSGGMSFLTPVIDFFSGIFTTISWSYPFLDNAWGFILKLIFLYPVSVGVVYGFIQLFVTIASGLVGLVRSLLPGA